MKAPFVHGVVRPRIFVPPDLEARLSPTQLDHTLMHELMHVKRADPLRAALSAVLICIYWFHPLVWVAAARLRELREESCDRDVARLVGDARSYRDSLAAAALRLSGDESAPGGIAFVTTRRPLLRRLALLDSPRVERSRLRRAAHAAASAVALFALLPVSSSAEERAREIADTIERPPGCMQLRFLVLERFARESAAHAGGAALPAKQGERP